MRITAVDALTMPMLCNDLGRSCHFHLTLVNQNATMHKNLTQGMYNISALWGVKPNLAYAIITQTCWYLSKEYSHTFIIAILVILQSTKFTKSVQLINAKARLVQCSYTKEPKNVLFVTLTFLFILLLGLISDTNKVTAGLIVIYYQHMTKRLTSYNMLSQHTVYT